VKHVDIAYRMEATLHERDKKHALESMAGARSKPGSITTVRQQVPLGLGHAIGCARAFIGDDPFAILLPDDLVLADTPCTKQLADVYPDDVHISADDRTLVVYGEEDPVTPSDVIDALVGPVMATKTLSTGFPAALFTCDAIAPDVGENAPTGGARSVVDCTG